MMHEAFSDWSKQYGKTFGYAIAPGDPKCLSLTDAFPNRYYEGGLPVLVTSDVDILHEVFVKRFSIFHGRKVRDRIGSTQYV